MGRLLLLCFYTLAFSFVAFGEGRGADLENPQRELDVFYEIKSRAEPENYLRILNVLESAHDVQEYDAAVVLTWPGYEMREFPEVSAKLDAFIKNLKARAEKGDEWAQVALLIYERKNNPPNAENDKKLIEFAERGNASACYALVGYQGYKDGTDFMAYKFELPSDDMRLKFEKIARSSGLLKDCVADGLLDISDAEKEKAIETLDKKSPSEFYRGELAAVAQFYIDLPQSRDYRERILDLLWYGTKRNSISAAVKLALLYADGSEELNIEKSDEKFEEVADTLDASLRGAFYLKLREAFLGKYGYYSEPLTDDDKVWQREKFKRANLCVEKAAEYGNCEAGFMLAMSLINGGYMSDDLTAHINFENVPLEKQREFIARILALSSKVEKMYNKSSLDARLSLTQAVFYLKAHESLRDLPKALASLDREFKPGYPWGRLLLFVMYNEGIIVEKDTAKAESYMDKILKSGLRDVRYGAYMLIARMFSTSLRKIWVNLIVEKNDDLAKKYQKLAIEGSEVVGVVAPHMQYLLKEGKKKEAKSFLDKLSQKKSLAYYAAALEYYSGDENKQISLMLERIERYPDFLKDELVEEEETIPYLALLSGAHGFKADKPAAESYLKRLCESHAAKNGNTNRLDWFRFEILRAAFVRLCKDSMGLDFERRVEVLNGIFEEIKEKRSCVYSDFADFYISRKNFEKAAEYLKEYALKANEYRGLFKSESELTPEHVKLELDILKVAAERNIPEALVIMSVLHREGRFVEKDAKLADELLKKLPADKNKSFFWFRDPFYGDWPWGRSLETAYKIDCMRADLGVLRSQLACMFAYMGCGPYADFVEPSREKCLKYTNQLEKDGELLILLYLHIFYDRGIAPFEKNEELAKKYAEAYEKKRAAKKYSHWSDISSEIFNLNTEGGEYFEGCNHEYALRVCEEAKVLSEAQLKYLKDLAMGVYSDSAEYSKRAVDILKRFAEKGNFFALKYCFESEICEAIRKGNYALALKIIRENSKFKINETAYLIRIALHLREENSPLLKNVLEEICSDSCSAWAFDASICLENSEYELLDEEDVPARVSALFAGQKSPVDFSQTKIRPRRTSDSEYKRIDLKKYYK